MPHLQAGLGGAQKRASPVIAQGMLMLWAQGPRFQNRGRIHLFLVPAVESPNYPDGDREIFSKAGRR